MLVTAQCPPSFLWGCWPPGREVHPALVCLTKLGVCLPINTGLACESPWRLHTQSVRLSLSPCCVPASPELPPSGDGTAALSPPFLVSQALQSNLKYSLLPRRLLISKRLAQCLHPALPSGVHLKALETYEIIFKIVGTKWLAKDLFLYRYSRFPLQD